ncbi:MAG: NADH-quinone oxidoreductase subunit L [Limisphaera sp.]|nr:NADH-quinone oxidoreductase subunit L [Limisphaera sp.]
MKFEGLLWWILLLPLAAAVGITLRTLKDPRRSATLSIGAALASFALTLLFWMANGWTTGQVSVTWWKIGTWTATFDLRVDPLSLLMLLVVTGVGSAIHVYSVGYMRGDPGYSRYFACLSLFMFSMLGIVLAGNFLQMFVFWELVGVSSYLLIGHWFERPAAADAAQKAFLTNRLGDLGFLAGILLLHGLTGTLQFDRLEETWPGMIPALGPVATVAGLLVFCGVVGKSAQFPLHVWLPDAMEGPTPVSALIHAATMVAAGVYLLCRVFFLFTPDALMVVAWTGGLTALLAAAIATQQNDIKRILAYSTLSQLGYMVMGVGLGAPAAGMFHLVTHAFFKALLFLGAGSVICALHHEQNIWRMGGLARRMPVTFWTFLVGTLALAGAWPLSGFFSKDALLAAAWERNLPLFALGLGVAGLTSFYMFRLVWVAFGGTGRSESAAHAEESPQGMLWPLRVLAALSVVAGVLGIQPVLQGILPGLEGTHGAGWWARLTEPFHHAPLPAAGGLVAMGLGLALAWKCYAGVAEDPWVERWPALSRWLRNRLYFDELYAQTVIWFHEAWASFAAGVERWVLNGLCLGLIRGGTDLLGQSLRLLQSGNLQTYALVFGAGVALLLWWVLGG